MAAIKRARIDEIWFPDRNNIQRKIRGLSLHSRKRFEALLDVVREIYNGQFRGKSIAAAYDTDRDFAFACDECLQLFGLRPDWFSISHLNALLFSYREPDGASGDGLLVQLEFSQPEPEAEGEESKPLPPNENPYHAAIASLWLAQPKAPLQEILKQVGALDSAQNGLCWADLQSILRSRNRMIRESDPEERKKEQQAKGREQAKQLYERWRNNRSKAVRLNPPPPPPPMP